MSLEPGQRLGPYRIVGPLGSGGMGEVYRARDERLDRDVAIKVLPAELAGNAEAMSRFQREAKATAALSHPHILAIHDFGDADGVAYAVTELLEGETVRQKLADGALPLRKALEYTLQAAQGLGAAHDKGVVHRDVKPENLFVTREGRLKILDFGLARQAFPTGGSATTSPTAPRHTDPGTMVGTVGYMSPEQVRGFAVDHRTDLFSLGAVLYEMVSGRRAFRAESTADTISAILREDPLQISATGAVLPPLVERVVRHCLEKNPEERFQSARDIAFALQAALDGSMGTSTALPVPPSAPRRRWPIAAGAALAAAVLAAAYLVGRGAARPEPPHFERLTFRRGSIEVARFAPDGVTGVYGARWEGGPPQVLSVRPGSPESRELVPDAGLLAVSASEELLVQLDAMRWHGLPQGTLARVPFGGGEPRRLHEAVQEADLGPGPDDLALLRMTEESHWRIEYPAGTVLLDGPRRIVHLRVSRDGGRLAFFHQRELADGVGALSTWDAAGGVVARVTDVRVTGIAWGPAEEVWYSTAADDGQSALWAVGAGAPRLLARVPGALRLQDVSPTGRALAELAIERSAVQLVESAGAARDLTWLDGTRAQDISADGKTLLLNESGVGGGPHGTFYLRPAEGGPALPLGEGRAHGLSPDGSYVLASLPGASLELHFVPTGAGTIRRVSVQGLTEVFDAWPLADGGVLASGVAAGQGERFFVIDSATGAARPVSPEGYSNYTGEQPVSPDGRRFTGSRGLAGHVELQVFSLEGAEPVPVTGYRQGDAVVRWSADGRGVYVLRRDELPAGLVRIDLATGVRTTVAELRPSDPAGVLGIDAVVMTPDARRVAFNFTRRLGDLFAIEGL